MQEVTAVMTEAIAMGTRGLRLMVTMPANFLLQLPMLVCFQAAMVDLLDQVANGYHHRRGARAVARSGNLQDVERLWFHGVDIAMPAPMVVRVALQFRKRSAHPLPALFMGEAAHLP
jgi:hypothetical protein